MLDFATNTNVRETQFSSIKNISMSYPVLSEALSGGSGSYKVSTDKVLQIEPKEDLKERTGKRSDWAEAFQLTCSVGKSQPGIRLL
jgi:hypothetical protein